MLGACGTDTVSRSTLTKSLVAEAEKSGATVDSGCISDAVSKLTDKDLAVIDKAIKTNADPTELSGEGMSVMVEIVSCQGAISGDSLAPAIEGLNAVQSLMVSEILKQFEGSGTKIDEACLQDLIKAIDSAELVDPQSEAVKSLTADVVGCVQG